MLPLRFKRSRGFLNFNCTTYCCDTVWLSMLGGRDNQDPLSLGFPDPNKSSLPPAGEPRTQGVFCFLDSPQASFISILAYSNTVEGCSSNHQHAEPFSVSLTLVQGVVNGISVAHPPQGQAMDRRHPMGNVGIARGSISASLRGWASLCSRHSSPLWVYMDTGG